MQTELRGLRQTCQRKNRQGAALQKKFSALEAEAVNGKRTRSLNNKLHYPKMKIRNPEYGS
ncbi:MAG: hypothetical protein R3F37_05275 [Candidatus Competibacteraceae bacterium]